MEQVKQLYEESGFPGYTKLYSIVKKKGIKDVSLAQVKAFVDSQTVAQLHKRPVVVAEIPITTAGKLTDFNFDLLDLSAFSRTNGGYKWMFIMINIWDRRCAARPIKSKSPNDVLPALKPCLEELGGDPVMIVSDSGTEWAGVVKRYLDQHDITHRTVPVGDHRSLGIVDSMARFIKNAITKHFTHSQKTEWVSYLPTLIKRYNDTPHGGLKAAGQPMMTPDEAAIRETDTRIVHHEKIQKARGIKRPTGLAVGNRVRVLKKKQIFDRGYEVRFSVTVYTIEKIDGNYYILSNGKQYRERDLQKIKEPQSPVKSVNEEAEEHKEEVIDVHRKDKLAHRVDNILEHQEGIVQSNKREGLRERKPANQVIDAKYGNIRW